MHVGASGVTGNPIRACYDPGGSDPLAELIRRIGFASGFDPPPVSQDMASPGQELRGSFPPKDIFSPRSFCPRKKAPTPG